MKKSFFILFFLALYVAGFTQEIQPNGKIIVKNPLIHRLVPEDPQIEILGDGFNWSEGPCWIPSEQKFVFSDVKENTVFEWTEKGGIKPYLKPSGYTGAVERGGEMGSNGLTMSPDGKLVLCMCGDRRIAAISDVANPKPNFITLSGAYEGQKFNSPNDLVFAPNGDLFFTDPPYGLERGMRDSLKEMDYQGVFKVDKNGNTVLLTKELMYPNGIGVSPDGKKLYVASSDFRNAVWMVYDLTSDHLIENGKSILNRRGLRQKRNAGRTRWNGHSPIWLVICFRPRRDLDYYSRGRTPWYNLYRRINFKLYL